jgi:Cu+-exporting ATPase
VNQVRITVGSLALFDEPVPVEIRAQVKSLESEGCTCILVHVEKEGFLGAIGLRDESKEDASMGVAALIAMGCEVFMITGDNFTTAHVIASEVGIDPKNVLANVLPSDKAAAIKALQDSGRRRVAMVGDGVNDAPALAASDCGLAIGAGTQIAIESADMVLLNSRIADVVVALDLSRVVLKRIRLNYAWAVVYNLVGLVFASGLLYPLTHTLVPPWVAAGAMAFSSVSVVSSSLLLRRYSRPKLEPGFGTRRGRQVVRVDSIRVETFDGHVLEQQVEPGCGMLRGEPCSCDPANCTCVVCKHHHTDSVES